MAAKSLHALDYLPQAEKHPPRPVAALFGDESLMAALRETRGMTPNEAADRLIASAQNWGRSQEDDLTVLVCDYRG